MTVTQLGVVGWIAGLLAYLAALGLIWGEWISGGDLRFVIVSSLVAFGACYLLLYVPVLSLVRRFLPRSTLIWVCPIAGLLIGIVPTALIARFWGGSFRALLTPEASLFLVLFTVVGLVVGVGFAKLDPK